MENKSCFQLKGSLFTLTVLQLYHSDLQCLEKELTRQVEQTPQFFNHTPIVIDLHLLEDNQKTLDFKQLKQIVCKLRMIPVGIKGATSEQKNSIDEAGLAILAEAKSATRHKEKKQQEQTPQPEPQSMQTKTTADNKISAGNNALEHTSTAQNQHPSPKPAQHPVTPQQSKVVRQTVRSGQQIYAANGDLIIIGSVSAGAEVLAAGNIHIYGTLRGRALAGVPNNTQANIFCHNLQSELISIAGIYLLCDDIPTENMGTTNHIRLVEEKLTFQPLI